MLFSGFFDCASEFSWDRWVVRLQNSPYFCVFKYSRAVKQKVSCATLYRFSLLILRKKPDCFAVYWVVLWSFIAPCIVHSAYETLHHMSFQDLCHVTLPLQCLRAAVITYKASVIYLKGDFLLILKWLRAKVNETLDSGFKEWRCLISLYIFLNTCEFPLWYIVYMCGSRASIEVSW